MCAHTRRHVMLLNNDWYLFLTCHQSEHFSIRRPFRMHLYQRGFVSRRLFCKRIGTRIFLPEEGCLPKELIDIVTFRWTFYQHINDRICFGGEISSIEKKAKLQFQQSDKVDCKQKTQCNSLFRNVTFGGLWLH